VTTNAIRLTSPHELLAIVPFVLGFHPTSSIVVLCLSDNRLGLTQRLDLPRPEDAHSVASALMPSLVNENPDSVILIGYEDSVGQSLAALEALTAALQSAAMRIHDRLVVRDGRWRSLDCHSPDCCPPGGSSVPEATDVSRVVAEFIGQGIAPHPDRQALAQQLEPGPQAVAVAEVLRSRQKARAKASDCPAAFRRMSRSIRRVLSSRTVAGTRRTVIHLGYSLPSTSSGLPASSGGPPSNACCLTLLQVGFT